VHSWLKETFGLDIAVQMQRYFFHLRNIRSADEPDLMGQELDGLLAARDIAVNEARFLAARDVRQGRLRLSDWIEVTDQFGRVLFSVEINDVVHVSR
jgi:hypothetical protein